MPVGAKGLMDACPSTVELLGVWGCHQAAFPPWLASFANWRREPGGVRPSHTECKACNYPDCRRSSRTGEQRGAPWEPLNHWSCWVKPSPGPLLLSSLPCVSGHVHESSL